MESGEDYAPLSKTGFTMNGFDGQKCDQFSEKLMMDCSGFVIVKTSRSSCLTYMHVGIFVCLQKHGRISPYF